MMGCDDSLVDVDNSLEPKPGFSAAVIFVPYLPVT
jgi:hypothetical protein